MDKKSVACFWLTIGLAVLGITYYMFFLREVPSRNICDYSYEECVKIQRNAVLANEALVNAFEHAETIIYRDDYGGDYIDFDKLVVQITEDADIEFYRKALQEYIDYVEFKTVDISFNELEHLASKFMTEMPKNAVVSVGIKPDLMSYHAEVLSTYRDEVLEKLEEEYEVNDAFNYGGVVQTAVVFEHGFVTFTDKAAELTATAAAGSGVQTKNNNGVTGLYSTLGGNGTFAFNGTTSNAFLVAGHAIDYTYCLLYKSTSYLGAIQYRQFDNNGYGDFAITTMSSSYYPTPMVQVAPSTAIPFVGYVLDPAVNTVVSSYGNTSGAASGTVVEKNITYSYTSPAITIKGMTRIYNITGNCQNGDSGGPVKVGNAFGGIINSRGYSGGFIFILFTPYYYMHQAGFTINTL